MPMDQFEQFDHYVIIAERPIGPIAAGPFDFEEASRLAKRSSGWSVVPLADSVVFVDDDEDTI